MAEWLTKKQASDSYGHSNRKTKYPHGLAATPKHDILVGMTDRLKDAIEVLRNLPEDDQVTVITAIMNFASQKDQLALGDR